jgi:hypothetical protein
MEQLARPIPVNSDLVQAVTRALASWSNSRRPMLLSELYYKAHPFLRDPASWPGPPAKAKDWVRSIPGVTMHFSETFSHYALALEHQAPVADVPEGAPLSPPDTASAAVASADAPPRAYSDFASADAPPRAYSDFGSLGLARGVPDSLLLFRATSSSHDATKPFRVVILLRALAGQELPDGAANDIAATSARLRWVVQMSKTSEVDWMMQASAPRCIGNSCVQFYASEALAADITRRAGDKWRSWYSKFLFAVVVRDSRLDEDGTESEEAEVERGGIDEGLDDASKLEGGTFVPELGGLERKVPPSPEVVAPTFTSVQALVSASQSQQHRQGATVPMSLPGPDVPSIDAAASSASAAELVGPDVFPFLPQAQHATEVITLWDVENVPVPSGVGSLVELKAALEVELAKMGYMARIGGYTKHQLVMATASTALFANLTRLNLGTRPEDIKLVLSRPKLEAADHDLRTEMLEALQRRRDLQARRVMAAATALALSSPWSLQVAVPCASDEHEVGGSDHSYHGRQAAPPPPPDARDELLNAHLSGRLLVCIVTKDADFLAHVSAFVCLFVYDADDMLSHTACVAVCINPPHLCALLQVNDVIRFGQKAVVCVPVPLNPDAPRVQLELAVAARRFYENAPGGGSVHIMEWRGLMQALAHILGGPSGASRTIALPPAKSWRHPS